MTISMDRVRSSDSSVFFLSSSNPKQVSHNKWLQTNIIYQTLYRFWQGGDKDQLLSNCRVAYLSLSLYAFCSLQSEMKQFNLYRWQLRRKYLYEMLPCFSLQLKWHHGFQNKWIKKNTQKQFEEPQYPLVIMSKAMKQSHCHVFTTRRRQRARQDTQSKT